MALINYVLAGLVGTLVALSLYSARVSMSGAVGSVPVSVAAV